MTDHWEFFPCNLDDQVAVVFFDQGAADDLPFDDLPFVMRLRIEMKAPRQDGLQSAEEGEALDALENDIREHCAEVGLAWVGRITSAGTRVYYVYVDDADARAESFDALISGRHGYDWAYAATEDDAGQVYWDELFPSELDWQVIKNRHVIDALREAGDPLTAARRIDHWAYFGDEAARRRYIAHLESERYEIEAFVDPDQDNDGYGVQFHHVAVPREDVMYAVTLELYEKANALEGEYDGWETEVVGA